MNPPVWFPSQELIESTRLYQWMQKFGFHDFDSFLAASTHDIQWFWKEAEKALEIEWFRPYNQVLDLSQGIKWPRWYVNGKLNVVHNALDKWAEHPSKSQYTALIWEGEDGSVRSYSYAYLSAWVSLVAQGLHQHGLVKGDRVGIYMPMIPETIVAMLAVTRIGAICSPLFSGYAAEAMSKRLNASTAKMLITADGFYRRGKIIAMKKTADMAANLSTCVEKIIVVRHLGKTIPWNDDQDIDWKLLESSNLADYRNGPRDFAEPMDSSDPCMIIYTSGTTGNPKGAVHTHSGFPIKSAFDAAFGMDLKEKDVLFWVTDMGWMMGPFLMFGALLNGATALLYEGSVDYPSPDRLWKIVENHHVTHLGISPSLVCLSMKEETFLPKKHDISSLRLVSSTGEPWNPVPWLWLFNHVCKGKIPIFNYSGGTEISGGILGNILLKPIAPASFNSPLPGMDIDIFNEDGHSVRNAVGELVIKQPWVGMTQGFWQEPDRYEDTYWNHWPDIWVHSDLVIVDDKGFWKILGRSDDTLKVAGKRIGPLEIESILVGHDSVLEAAAIGVPDPIKGQAAVCFVVLKIKNLATLKLQQDLLDLVAEKLGKALRPQSLLFIDELPKTRNGKVIRRAIRTAYLGEDTGDLGSIENQYVLENIRSYATSRV